MKNILITRSKIRSKRIGICLEKEGLEVFFEPLFSVKKNPLKTETQNKKTSELKTFEAKIPIIFSSSNAIYILKKYNIPKNATIYSVGSVTAKKIKKLGYKNVFYPQKNSGSELLKIILKNLTPQKIHYFHGEKISFDFKKNLQKKGFEVDCQIVYKTIEIKNFSEELINFTKKKYFYDVLIFSQNSLEIFYKNCIRHNLIEYFNCSNIICLSNKIAVRARKNGFQKVSTFKKYPLLKNFYDTR